MQIRILSVKEAIKTITMINSGITFKIRDKRLPLSFSQCKTEKIRDHMITYSTPPNDKSEAIFY